ncbi:MAG TPA: hypothetical protein VFC63_20890 [Blastocatellia bacterium]|nr:hypothetical protein [Blastocatellia bacterium]
MKLQNSQRGAVSQKTLSTLVTVAIILIVIAYGLWKFYKRTPSLPSRPPVAGLPEMTVKPKPEETSFEGCSPEGEGRDRQLNLLKNRVDEGHYTPVAFDAIEKLTWPAEIDRKTREHWSSSDVAEVSRYEGIPVSVEGYLAGVKLEGPESTNCHGSDNETRDYHIWLTASPGEDRSASIVVEATPRVRYKHPAWTISNLERLVKDQTKVRISGWLMLDPEHPDQVGKTRGTIWEIHPIMKIEINRSGWQTLE